MKGGIDFSLFSTVLNTKLLQRDRWIGGTDPEMKQKALNVRQCGRGFVGCLGESTTGVIYQQDETGMKELYLFCCVNEGHNRSCNLQANG